MSIIQKGIAKAVGVIAKVWPDQPVDPMIDAHGVIGQPMSRVDGPLKVAGAARFVAEVPYERLAFASLVFSTIGLGTGNRFRAAGSRDLGEAGGRGSARRYPRRSAATRRCS